VARCLLTPGFITDFFRFYVFVARSLAVAWWSKAIKRLAVVGLQWLSFKASPVSFWWWAGFPFGGQNPFGRRRQRDHNRRDSREKLGNPPDRLIKSKIFFLAGV